MFHRPWAGTGPEQSQTIMQMENFESKIQRIAESFDRRPPQQSWDYIRQELHHQRSPSAGKKPARWALPVVLAAAILLIGIVFWPLPGSQPKWLDSYLIGRDYAQQQNKPILILFTRACPDCKEFHEILNQSNIGEFEDQYIPVRLSLDNQTPMDAAPAVPALFPDRKFELLDLADEYGQSAWRVEDLDLTLRTWGKVWEFWMEDVFNTLRPPVLVLLSPQEERIAQFNYVVNTELSPDEMSVAVRDWLQLNLGLLKSEHMEGNKLFVSQCAACHNQNMRDPLTGPALGGIREKWSDYPETDLYDFIRNSQKMISEGHPLAVANWNAWKPTIMTPFPDLSDREMKKLVDYIEWKYSQE